MRVEQISVGATATGVLILSRLRLGSVTPDLQGVYVCLATNNIGYRFQEAKLTVLSSAAAANIGMFYIPNAFKIFFC